MLILRQHTDSREFRAHVYDHYDGHDQGQDVHKVVSRLEDERVGDLNSPGITACLDTHAIADILMAHSSAEGYRRLFAYRLEVAEAHCRRTGEAGARECQAVEVVKSQSQSSSCATRISEASGGADD